MLCFVRPVNRFVFAPLAVLVFCLVVNRVVAYDDAELLSLRIPDQRYRVFEEFSVLRREKMDWFIRLWACDAGSFEITKVLGGTAPAPYAVKITPKSNHPISSGYPYMGRRYSIHVLAASLDDATRIRRALIREVDVQQKNVEKKHRNPPGHLKRLVSSWKG
jgi:hypothetical protein